MEPDSPDTSSSSAAHEAPQVFPNLTMVAEEKRKESSQDQERRLKKDSKKTLSFLDAYTAVGQGADHGHGVEPAAAAAGAQHGADHAGGRYAQGEEQLAFIMALLARTSAAIGIIGALILILGCMVAFVNLSMLCLKVLPLSSPIAYALGDSTRTLTLNLIRSQLGHIIVFTLEILVAADVIETLAVPVHAQSFGNLGKIAIIVAVRTCLSFFLEKELEVVDEELKHEQPLDRCVLRRPTFASESWNLHRPPSLMLLATVFFISGGLILLIAERFQRQAPVAELVVLAAGLFWCHSAGSAYVALGLLGVALLGVAIIFRQEVLEYASQAFQAFAQVAVPSGSWSLRNILFWGAGVSCFAWLLAWLAVQLGMQRGVERLWLAIVIVGISLCAVNNFPMLRIETPKSTPMQSPAGEASSQAPSRSSPKDSAESSSSRNGMPSGSASASSADKKDD